MNPTSIPAYYKDKTVLVTGGTGFIGKVLIEKLLRSCKDLKRIVVLVRSKKGKSVEERMELFKNEVVFQVIRDTNPTSMDKVVGIETDLSVGSMALLGDKVLQEDLKDVNVIFHCAASVRFDDSLKEAILMNVCATKEMLDFAKTLPCLDAFVHVSTAYSNCDRFDIEEKIYPSYMDWQYLVKCANTVNENVLNALFNKLSNNLPNTYVFTKNISEALVNDFKDVLPVVIFRPSIVGAAETEPLPGFVDNFNGPVGLLVACSMGIQRTSWHPSQDSILNGIPVDMCVKGMIVAAVKHAKLWNKDETLVYNAASIKCSNALESVKIGKKYVMKAFPADYMIWRPGGNVTTSYYEFYLRLVFAQILPALLVDTVLRALGKKPMLMKLQRILMCAQVSLHYFINKTWNMKNHNFLSLNGMLLESELEAFELKEQIEDMIEYLKISMLGARRYLLKWPDSNLGNARKRYQRLILLDNVLKYVFWFGIIWVLVVKCCPVVY